MERIFELRFGLVLIVIFSSFHTSLIVFVFTSVRVKHSSMTFQWNAALAKWACFLVCAAYGLVASKCPLEGRYNIHTGSTRCDSYFRSGCNGSSMIDIISTCSSRPGVSSLHLHAQQFKLSTPVIKLHGRSIRKCRKRHEWILCGRNAENVRTNAGSGR